MITWIFISIVVIRVFEMGTKSSSLTLKNYPKDFALLGKHSQ